MYNPALLITVDVHYLTQSLVGSSLHSLLEYIVLDTELFKTHGFRIGAATTAGAVGLSEPQIKMLRSLEK